MSWRYLVARLFRRAEVERDLDEEVRAYYQEMVDRAVARGMSPEEAQRAARLAFGGPEEVKQRVREGRRGAGIDTLAQDLRQAVRVLRRSPGFTFFAVVTIALCLGANAAIFSLVDGVLLKGTGYPEPERIVLLWEKPPRGLRNGISAANYRDWAAQSRSFSAMSAEWGSTMSYSGARGGEPQSLRVGRVSAPYFDVFGVAPALGRTFARDEDQVGKEKVAVLSHRLWAARFGGERSIVGRTIHLDGAPYTVIGVMPEDSAFDRRPFDLWVPLPFAGPLARDYHFLRAVARLAPGVTFEQAQAEMSAIAGRIAELYPDVKKGWGATLDRYLDQLMPDQTRLSLKVLMAAVAVVLFIGCANLANLLLARGTLRAREIALRLALGARRGRVIRMLLTESLVLATAGALAGIALGRALLAWIQGLLPPFYFHAEARIGIDGRVLLFLGAVTVLTTVAFGLVPALQAARRQAADSLKVGALASTAGRGQVRARQLFIAAQVAIAFVLLAAGGLLVRSLQRVMTVDTGYDPQGLMAAGLPLANESPEAGWLAQYAGRIVEEVRAQPGVREVAVTTAQPLRGWGDNMPMRLPGKGEERLSTGFKVVTPGYFPALGLRLHAGRLLDARDGAGSAPVVVVNQSFVRKYFPDRSPVGQRILVDRILPSRRGLGPQTSWEIVGVVGDEKATGLERPTDVGAYASFAQNPVAGLSLVVRGSAGGKDGAALIKAVERAVWRVNERQSLDRPRMVAELKRQSTMGRRLTTTLLAGFALLALLLACAGIYGVLSFVTARRTHELGIRAALGATRGDLVRLVLGGGAVPILAGIAAGVVGAVALSRVIESLLFATSARDIPNLVESGALLLFVALAACFVPAWRAARVAPMTALRRE